MAGDAKKLQPIIIKRVKKGGHAAHGGAWKIAYADFVTAMMAFFLLMWLLGSTTEGDKKGLSDYFQSPLKVAMQGGSGSGASNSILPGGGSDLTQTAGQAKSGDGRDRTARRMSGDKPNPEATRKESQGLAELSARIAAEISNNPKMVEFQSQVKLEITPDGLLIQIVDDQRRPMFDSGSAQVKPYMRAILQEIGLALGEVNHKISLDGHTDRAGYANAATGYSNWELSADRANASRRELLAAGMPESHLARVVGMGSSLLYVPEDPYHPTNRRISILVMTREAEERLLGKRLSDDENSPGAPAPTPSAGSTH